MGFLQILMDIAEQNADILDAFFTDDDGHLTLEDDEVKEALTKLDKALDGVIEKIENSKKKKVKLERCPICGCTAHVHQEAGSGKYYIACGYCPLETKAIFDDEEEAADYWNER